jgi:CelD/BcsL family acetyltransferase involved in cellulose biosynthesis
MLLSRRAFADDWERLRRRCPWSTAFQGFDFVSAWYQCYAGLYEPVIACSRSPEGLLGLLALAQSANGPRLSVAGARQAEYQCWLCLPELAERFAWEAIRAVGQGFPGARLGLRYLPPGVPLDWARHGQAGRVCSLEEHRRPLLRFADGGEIDRSLAKKSNKSRLNRLRKIGPLEFVQVTDAEELERHVDDIIRFYDIRQAAEHDSRPFGDDRHKRAFHLAMAKASGLLHVTLLKVAGRLASAHLGVVSGKEVQLGIIAHNPALGAHSPGKFHILMLARMLLDQGFDRLDLTPGGDAYKERFANDHDTVHSLVVHGSPLGRLACRVGEASASVLRTAMKKLHVSPRAVKALVRKARRVSPVRTPLRMFAGACQAIHRRREMRVYYFPAKDVPEIEAPLPSTRDSLEDLLAYEPCEAWQSRKEFLLRCLDRIERGLHSYTHAEGGRLLQYGWLIERQEKSFVTEVHQEFEFPPRSACLYDSYTFVFARGRGLYTANIRKMLHDASRILDTDRIYALVLADNGPSRHVIEKVGFTYDCSLFEEVWFGRARRWTNAPSRKGG